MKAFVRKVFRFINKKIKVECKFLRSGALCKSATPGNKVDSLPGAISSASTGTVAELELGGRASIGIFCNRKLHLKIIFLIFSRC